MNVLAVLIALGVALSSVLLIRGTAASRRTGPGGPLHDRVEAAFLRGGPARVVDAAIAALHEDGRLVVAGPGIVAVQRPVAYDPVERAVLDVHASAPSGALHVLRLAAMRHPSVQAVGDALAARGLILPRDAGRKWRRWSLAQGLTCLLLLFVSIPLTVIELVAHGLDEWPIPFIGKVAPVLVAGGVVAGVCGSVAGRRVTGAGNRAIAAFTGAHAHSPDAGHRVALYGLRAVPDPVLAEQLVAAARMNRGGARSSDALVTTGVAVTVWCAASDPGGSGCGSASCGSSGSGCGGGSGCGTGSGSGCGGSSGGSSGGGSSCGGGGSSCGGGSSS
ncbi:TIGR04222 domain-containing membrane protein [Streptomyces sp. NPDC006368]|uniref:TIGR04222 domain-containing membrane protein n=1 Tax=Streptomyces sp. NPDC006368 TaxID=3156760 RepID=UPI0033A1150F